MTDIAERLRALAREYHQHRPHYNEAAGEIERLHEHYQDRLDEKDAEIERLRADLSQVAMVHYEQLKAKDAEIGRLRERCVGYMGQVKWGSDVIERLQQKIKDLKEEILDLKTGLDWENP